MPQHSVPFLRPWGTHMPDTTRHRWRAGAWRFALPAFALGVAGLMPLANGAPPAAQAAPAAPGWTPLSPVSVSYSTGGQHQTTTLDLLAFNDFHGNIDPPIGGAGLVAG